MTRNFMAAALQRLMKRKAQGMAEFILIVSFVAMVVLFALSALGFQLTSFFTSFTEEISRIR